MMPRPFKNEEARLRRQQYMKIYSKEYSKKHRAEHREYHRERAHIQYWKNPEKARAIALRSHRKAKAETIAAYGGQCVCCGEKDIRFLTIDHIKRDGAAHRKSIAATHGGKGAPAGMRVWSWLRKRGYPKDNFRILCFNCNCGREVNQGVCPHVEQLLEAAANLTNFS